MGGGGGCNCLMRGVHPEKGELRKENTLNNSSVIDETPLNIIDKTYAVIY